MSTFETGVILKNFSTLGIGGPADYFVCVRKIDELKATIEECNQRKLNYFILGKGSNCLFDDRGFKGVVIYNKIDFFEELSPGVFHVGAGYSFSLLGTQTAKQGWSGLEFASGIPGSVGGAVYMNAGANGSDVSMCLAKIDYIDEAGHIQNLKKDEISFSYRHTSFQERKGAIIGATFQLQASVVARKNQLEMISYRTATQPYSEKTAGCFFRNPQCNHAGSLIEKAGLKNFQIGGARVSKLHANFIENADNASCSDVLKLVKAIKDRVKTCCDVDLHTEVRFIPYEAEDYEGI